MLGNVDIKVRPIRLAYLVDPNQQEQVREAIRLSATLWGGVYFPIIPLHKRMPATWRDKPLKAPEAKKVLLGYIEAFDPDILVQLSRSVPEFITNTGLQIIQPTNIWEGLAEERNLSPKFGIGIFELLSDIFEEHFRYKPKYPVRVVIPRIPAPLSLFWTSLFGEIPPSILDVIEKRYFKHLEIQSIDFASEKLAELLAGDVLFPRRIVERGLTSFTRSSFGRDALLYFLDATRVEDVVDFWNLRALGKKILPVPKQLQGDPGLRNIILAFLKNYRRRWRHDPKVCDFASIIKGRSTAMGEMEEYAKTLEIRKEPGDPSDSPFFSLQHWYPRIWDEWARDKDGAAPADIYGETEGTVSIDSKTLQIHFKPLWPDFAYKHDYHGEPRCANEISFRLYGSEEYVAEVFPKSSGKNFQRAISGLVPIRGDWRVGRNGLVKLVTDDFSETRNIPTGERIVFSYLADLGWKPQLSAPGLLAKQMYRQLDGYPAILRNETLLGLLEHMNGGLVKQDGTPVEKSSVTQERELPIGEVKSRLEGPSKRSNLYDYLLSKKVFKLGLRVQCPHCLRHSWFSLEAVRDTFSCPRCLNTFGAIGAVSNSTWCYKTTGPFSVPHYADGAYAVLLTLEFFNDRNFSTMRTTPVLSFKAQGPDNKSLEADIASFWQDSIFGERKDGVLFAECKTYDRFSEKDFRRMRQLAKAFPGAILAFSTLRKSLTHQEIVGMTRVAKAGRKYWKSERPINPVLVLTGTELLNHLSPPYCWDESVKKRFNHIRGLLGLCDTTQQIYLNLPSWHTEWHEKWEKKRRSLLAKQAAQQPNLNTHSLSEEADRTQDIEPNGDVTAA